MIGQAPCMNASIAPQPAGNERQIGPAIAGRECSMLLDDLAEKPRPFPIRANPQLDLPCLVVRPTGLTHHIWRRDAERTVVYGANHFLRVTGGGLCQPDQG